MIRMSDIKITNSQLKDDVGGINKKVLGLLNGRKVMVKGDSINESIKEWSAAKLGRKIGLNTNRVELILNDVGNNFDIICTAHYWEDNFKITRELPDERKNFTEEELTLLKFFDTILSNYDRNTGNFGRLNGEMFLIDHGLADMETDFCNRERMRIEDILGYDFKTVENCISKFVSLTELEIINCIIPSEEFYDFLGGYVDVHISRIIQRILEVQEFTIETMKNLGDVQRWPILKQMMLVA